MAGVRLSLFSPAFLSIRWAVSVFVSTNEFLLISRKTSFLTDSLFERVREDLLLTGRESYFSSSSSRDSSSFSSTISIKWSELFWWSFPQTLHHFWPVVSCDKWMQTATCSVTRMRWKAYCVFLIFSLIIIHVNHADAQRPLLAGRVVRIGIGRFYNRVSAIRKLVM